ncbi:hypothetical protein [Luteimonas saliphila]|uniref:hypothetical protein n=1 Tax=Luteimonas saliphila TaxID=2804919 RepID=UPI00192DA454|nr:hypothetical protein [Luteimonas saliphila]
MKELALAIAVLLQATSGDYVRSGAIGRPTKAAEECSDLTARRVAAQCLIGERLMILPKPKAHQEYGYQFIKPSERAGRRGIKYEEGVGKTGVVQAVVADEHSHRAVRVRMDDGSMFDIHSYGQSGFDDIAFLRDIDEARRSYLGKRLWLNTSGLGVLDEAGNTSSVSVPRFSGVTVRQIVASQNSRAPSRLIVATDDGVEGFIDLQMTSLNSHSLSLRGSTFDGKFFDQDPRSIYKWSERAWGAIRDSRAYVGMNAEQLLMSWGAPESVNRTALRSADQEQWVYGLGRYVYLERDVVTAIQD